MADEDNDTDYIVIWKGEVTGADDFVHAGAIAKAHMMNQDRLTDNFLVQHTKTGQKQIVEVELEEVPNYKPDPNVTIH